MATIELEVPEGLDPEVFRARFRAELEQGAVLRALAETMGRSERPVAPATAASVAGVEQLWRRMIETYGTYTSAEIAQLRGSDPKNRSVASNFAKRNGVLGFLRGRQKLYPRFQFDGAQVHPDWPRLTGPLLDAGWSERMVLMWAGSPSGFLDGREPASLIGTEEADRAVEDAQQEALGFVG